MNCNLFCQSMKYSTFLYRGGNDEYPSSSAPRSEITNTCLEYRHRDQKVIVDLGKGGWGKKGNLLSKMGILHD